MDWKDALNQLKSQQGFPSGNETSEPEEQIVSNETNDEKRQKAPLRILIDKKGRKGKTATIIEGILAEDQETERLAKLLKQKLGTGGSWLPGEILLQGDCKTEAAKILRSEGYQVK